LVNGRPEDKKEARTRPDLRIGALGSGSDYTTFVDHLGIASLNVGYGGEDDGGVYHSVYDDFYWFTHFSDRDFIYGRALAQTIGSMVLRFADAEVLPYDFSDFADTMHKYEDELKKLLKDHQEEASERDQDLADGAYAAASDPRRPTFAPPKEELPPFINFAPLDNALAALDRSAQHYSKAIQGFDSTPAASSSRQVLQALNQKLIQSERKLSNSQGLPRRPWFESMIYAPGYYTGYGAKTMPGVREAIEENRYSDAEHEVTRVAKALDDYAAAIDEAAGELEQAAKK